MFVSSDKKQRHLFNLTHHKQLISVSAQPVLSTITM